MTKKTKIIISNIAVLYPDTLLALLFGEKYATMTVG